MSSSTLVYDGRRTSWIARTAYFVELTKPRIALLELLTLVAAAFVASSGVPSDVLNPGCEPRVLHRAAFGDVVPAVVRDRTDKAEFSPTLTPAFSYNAPAGLERLETHDRGWTRSEGLVGWSALSAPAAELVRRWPVVCVSSWLHSRENRLS